MGVEDENDGLAWYTIQNSEIDAKLKMKSMRNVEQRGTVEQWRDITAELQKDSYIPCETG